MAGHRLSALLQLGTPVAKALVLGLERLPLPPDSRLGFLEGLMSAGQHLGEGSQRCPRIDARPERSPKDNLKRPETPELVAEQSWTRLPRLPLTVHPTVSPPLGLQQLLATLPPLDP